MLGEKGRLEQTKVVDRKSIRTSVFMSGRSCDFRENTNTHAFIDFYEEACLLPTNISILPHSYFTSRTATKFLV